MLSKEEVETAVQAIADGRVKGYLNQLRDSHEELRAAKEKRTRELADLPCQEPAYFEVRGATYTRADMRPCGKCEPCKAKKEVEGW